MSTYKYPPTFILSGPKLEYHLPKPDDSGQRVAPPSSLLVSNYELRYKPRKNRLLTTLRGNDSLCYIPRQ